MPLCGAFDILSELSSSIAKHIHLMNLISCIIIASLPSRFGEAISFLFTDHIIYV